MRYIVFSGAPRRCDVLASSSIIEPRWTTTKTFIEPVQTHEASSSSILLPDTTVDAAHDKLQSYAYVVSGNFFAEPSLDEGEEHESFANSRSRDSLSTDSSAITWEATQAEMSPKEISTSVILPNHVVNTPEGERVADESQRPGDRTSLLSALSNSLDDSVLLNDASIAWFPAFTYNPAKVSSLSSLPSKAQKSFTQALYNVLVGVLEITGPDVVNTKTGPVSLLQLVLGDGSGPVTRLAVWRELAEDWAPPAVRRGDVVHFSNLVVAAQGGGLTASARQRSSFQVCYRVLPTVPADARLRPDLRLGQTDAAVRQVSSVVRWVEQMAGIS